MPTDLICYVCGSMRITFRRFILGVLIGEGAIVGVYIFAGSALLELGKRVFGPDVAEAQVAAQPDGAAVYAEHCALCHEQVDERIPHRSALQQMSAGRIVRALDAGAMLAIAMSMDRDERLAVAAYLGTDADSAELPAAAYCTDRTVTLAATPRAAWNGWSPMLDNARYQPAERASLSAARVPSLTLKWAFGYAGDVNAFAAPTVIDGHVFVGSAGGLVHALDADSGCVKWAFQARGPVRAAPIAVVDDGRPLLLLGDLTGWFYAVNAATGELLWSTQVETHDSTRLTASAAVYEGVAFLPVRRGKSRAPAIPRIRAARSAAASSLCASATARSCGRPISPTHRASSARTAPARRCTGRRAWPSGRRRLSTRRAASCT